MTVLDNARLTLVCHGTAVGAPAHRRAGEEEALLPSDYQFGCERLVIDATYGAVYNGHNATLVASRQDSLDAINASGLSTTERPFECDATVYAVGFDSTTGAKIRIAVCGIDAPERKLA